MPNKRALIVDDSTTAQYRLKKMLRPYDLDTDSVDSGEAALRYLATHIPDVIFMDHLMPGMDGFRALQIIKSHPETAMIPVIMYTSKSGDVYTGQARALGALDVVSKDSINAADLSNVMRTIHIYRTDENVPEADNITAKNNHHEASSPEKTEVYNPDKSSSKFVDITNHSIERKTSSTDQQARNLELRLSHMEHTLEDSRRFITDRVVRELQSLKQNLKQEFNEIAEHNHAIHPIPVEPRYTVGGIVWAIVSKLFILIPLVAIAFYMMEMNDALTASQQQQLLLSKQLNAITGAEQPVAAEPASTVTNLGNVPPASDATVTPLALQTSQRMDKNYLADIAWTFNQTASIPFNQNDIDTNIVIRLYELLNRLASNGFKGTAWINIYVGNFCLATDNVGQAQLVNDGNFMGTCMLSSEVYGMDRLMEQYAHDVEQALAGLDQRGEKGIHVIINTLSEPDDYPERKATLSAKTWNAAAQKHNRIEIKLEDKVSDSSQANISSAQAQ